MRGRGTGVRFPPPPSTKRSHARVLLNQRRGSSSLCYALPMGNLGDALHKAGLISETELARAKQGRGPGDQLMRRHEVESAATEAQADEARRLIRERGAPEKGKGRRRWHYVAGDGSIPSMQVDDRLASRLEAGQAAIATDGEQARIIPREVAVQADKLDPSTILFWIEDA